MLANAAQRPTIEQLLPTIKQFVAVAIKAQYDASLWNEFEIDLDSQ